MVVRTYPINMWDNEEKTEEKILMDIVEQYPPELGAIKPTGIDIAVIRLLYKIAKERYENPRNR